MSQKVIAPSWKTLQILHLHLFAVFLCLGNFLIQTLGSPHPRLVLYRNLLESNQTPQDSYQSSKAYIITVLNKDRGSGEKDDCDEDDDEEGCPNLKTRRFWKNFGIVAGVVAVSVVIMIIILYICTKKLRNKKGKKFFWTRKSEIRAVEEAAQPASNIRPNQNEDINQDEDRQQNISPFVLPCRFSSPCAPHLNPDEVHPNAPILSPLYLELDQVQPASPEVPPIYTERELPPPYDFSEKQLEKTHGV